MGQEMEQNFDGRGGALVEEAKRLMQESEEPEHAEQENAGPKIKMSRIGGKKGKKPTRAAGADDKEKKNAMGIDYPKPTEKISAGGGFSEQDIEFMKKAIQVLCQSTNPLGKSIDFVTDDIESMNKEYEHWRKES